MDDKDREFMEHLLSVFKVEADEHLTRISSGLIEMEKAGISERRNEIIEEVFREAHSLKGAARSVRVTDIEVFCQALEDFFAAVKQDGITLSPELFDLLHKSTDFLRMLLAGSDRGTGTDTDSRQTELVRRLREAVEAKKVVTSGSLTESGETEKQNGGSAEAASDQALPQHPDTQPASTESSSGPGFPTSETVRVSTAKLSSLLLQSEEMLATKLAADQRVAQMRETKATFRAWEKEWAKILPVVQRVRSPLVKTADGKGEVTADRTNREIEKVIEFLEWNRNYIADLEYRYSSEAKSLKHDSLFLGAMVNNLLEDVKKVLMFPFSSLLEAFPRIIRDLSRDYAKEVDLEVRGGEIEIDRRILEELKSPLVHIVRNCIDHGIEKPEERRLKNKPCRGMITVTVSPKDDKVEVCIVDDGAGIALDRVRSAVLKQGMIPNEKAEHLSDREILLYVFQSGISTSPIITEISGRGLGLAIVREKVEKFGGTVSLETAPDAGTSIHILIPQTVATFRGILVRVGGQAFVVPTMYVERTLRLRRDEIKTVENRETIEFDGRAVSLARLMDILRVSSGTIDADTADLLPAVILSAGGITIAFILDEVLGEQEVLLKGLGRQLSRVRNVAGATILGSGSLVPVLNVPDLLKSAMKCSATPSLMGVSTKMEDFVAAKRSVMVVEDSITTRTLLKSILEAVGYDVVTAVDGLDALTKLKSAEFDIVISDVDMPRMNGFDLTARIRSDKKLDDLPVVLVTALESREDRERGIEVGASAYIVKSSFDQGNLLEVIKRLV